MELLAKLMIKNGENIFLGPGVKGLLTLIEKEKSVKNAAEKMGLSYSKAWTIIKNAETGAGERLVLRMQGGRSGGGADLTDKGKGLLSRYIEFEKEANEMLSECFRRHFDGKEEA